MGGSGTAETMDRFKRRLAATATSRRLIEHLGSTVRALPSDVRRALTPTDALRRTAAPPDVITFGSAEEVTVDLAAVDVPRGWAVPHRYRLPQPFLVRVTDAWIVGANGTVVTGEGRILLNAYREHRWAFGMEPNEDVIDFVRSGAFRSRAGKPIEGPVMSMVGRFDRNYFHWLTEHCAQLEGLESAGAPGGASLLVAEDRPRFLRQSLEVLAPGRPVLGFRPADGPVRVRELWVASFRGTGIGTSAKALDWLRERAWSAAPAPSAGAPERVAIVRPPGGWRSIVNTAEVASVFRSCGWHVVDPATLDFGAQVTLFTGIDRLAGQHGAGLVNAIFARQQATVLELRGRYGDASILNAVTAAGHRFRGLACPAEGDDIVVDAGRLAEVLATLA